MIKKIGKAMLCSILESQVKHLRKKNSVTVVAVGGSVGKTSTKLAIAKLLSADGKVRFQDGNYNDRLTVPLIFFDEVEPPILNIVAWLRLLMRTHSKSRQKYDYKYVVAELGTDGPGQMRDFAYLKPELYVLTAIAEEHMEYFGTIEAVAAEELVPLGYAVKTLINVDDVAAAYLPTNYMGYGFSEQAQYKVDLKDDYVKLTLNKDKELLAAHPLIGKQGAKIVMAAVAVADTLGVSAKQIEAGLANIKPAAGRMQKLKGIKGSVLLDDTYNASPIAVKAALDVLCAIKAPQKIAILGAMNELGDVSAQAHREVGAYCDPEKLDLVVTIGEQANAHLALAAQEKGCETVSFLDPYAAGDYVKHALQPGAVVLAKGSQNGVFAEEALKRLLADKHDAAKLVRQSPYWLDIKNEQFGTKPGQ
jgi:UDP-N-acetylmuramoyl-tripeptide--D-alanyl-D-alanine ligase